MSASAWAIGSALPELRLPPLKLDDLQDYAAASGDDAAVHLDPAAALAFGFRTAFAHGLFSMALLGRLLTRHFAPHELRRFAVRFSAPYYLDEVLVCSATVVDVSDGVAFELIARNPDGEVKLIGTATIVPDRDEQAQEVR